MKRQGKRLGKCFAARAVWVICLGFCPLAWAQDGGPSAFPEGSSSIIQTRTWQIAGSDPTALREQVKAVVEKIGQAVLVKEDEEILIISLPTDKLAALHHKLAQLGQLGIMQTAEEEAAPSAPTTLLRIAFCHPPAAS